MVIQMHNLDLDCTSGSPSGSRSRFSKKKFLGSDGASVMLGKKSGVLALEQKYLWLKKY